MTVEQEEPKRARKQLILSAATTSTARNWQNEKDNSRDLSRNLDSLIEFAQIAERGKFNNIFFVDHLSWFDVYNGGFESAAKFGVNATRIDPTIAIAALAANTESIGFITTASTVSEHPYHFARRIASVDHLSGGRAGWNIVGSYIPSIGKNLLNGDPLPEHDERYVKSEEFLDIVYKLLLSSWRDDAVVYNKKNGVFANPDALREINHEGKFFKVKGPGITEPTNQRIPLIAQAGNSPKGVNYAAENAELVYIAIGSAHKIPEIRKIAQERFNRDPNSIKFIAAIAPFLGKTHEEAQQKYEDFKAHENPESTLVYYGGVSGHDVGPFDWDEPIPIPSKTNGVSSTVDIVKGGSESQTKAGIVKNWGGDDYVGTGEEIADLIEELITKYEIDGFNFWANIVNDSLKDIVDILVPELQKRGLAQTDYSVPGGTLRENFNGKAGQTFLSGDHPAYNLRWRSGVSKEQFEKELELYEQLRLHRRKLADGAISKR